MLFLVSLKKISIRESQIFVKKLCNLSSPTFKKLCFFVLMRLQKHVPLFLLLLDHKKTFVIAYSATSSWSCNSTVPSRRCSVWCAPSPRPPAPRASTDARIAPAPAASEPQSRDHRSVTSWVPGAPCLLENDILLWLCLKEYQSKSNVKKTRGTLLNICLYISKQWQRQNAMPIAMYIYSEEFPKNTPRNPFKTRLNNSCHQTYWRAITNNNVLQKLTTFGMSEIGANVHVQPICWETVFQ